MQWSCDFNNSVPFAPYNSFSNNWIYLWIQWITKSDIKSFYKVKVWKLLVTFLARMTVWTWHCIYVGAGAQVPQIDLCRQLTQEARLTQVSATQDSCETQSLYDVWQSSETTSFGFNFPRRPDRWFWPASWGFDQHLSVQGRKVCSHLVIRSIEVQVGWLWFCLNSSGLFLGRNVSTDL